MGTVKVSSVLIVTSKEKTFDFFRRLLSPYQYKPVDLAENAGEAERIMNEQRYDIVIIDTPLFDDFGTSLAVNLSRFQSTGIIVLSKSELYEQIRYKIGEYGIVTLSKPLERYVAEQIINAMSAILGRVRTMENKTETLENKMEEIKLCNRAKLILINRLNMTEPEAHRYIEKNAMDRCVKRSEVASGIIKTYES